MFSWLILVFPVELFDSLHYYLLHANYMYLFVEQQKYGPKDQKEDEVTQVMYVQLTW